MTPGYQALRHGAAVLDLSARGRIRVSGEDRARLLHAMTTNHIQKLTPGEGLYAFFLNAQGRIQADVYVLCFDDHFLLDTEPQTRSLIFEHLDRYIIADDVTLEDVTDETFCLGLEGREALSIAQTAGIPALPFPVSHASWNVCTVAAVTLTGAPSVRLYGPLAGKTGALSALLSAGAVSASPQEAEELRIENFRPRFGQDITESTLPQETRQMHALHFQKGCYLGQEIVERIRSRGHVNKHLMGFRLEGHALEGPEVVLPGMKLFAGGKEAGEVTSAAAGAEGGVSGLAYVRTPYNKPGDTVGIEGRPAELFAAWGDELAAR
jgi:folate-binding protein YgfZ